jgi:endonuclease III
VLLFSLGMPAFPVDTHVHRVTGRLGLIGPKVSREQAHVILEELLPQELYYAFHLNVIRHGREVCAARSPRCDACVLADICSYWLSLKARNDLLQVLQIGAGDGMVGQEGARG